MGRLDLDHLDAWAVGVVRHVEDPAGPDEAGDRELGSVRLRPVLVELEELPVAPTVAEVVLRDLPQALVEPANRRLHYVDLLGTLRPAVVAGVQHRFRPRPVPARAGRGGASLLAQSRCD